MASSGTPITFNGSSTYASSFQQVITRAVGIASLPMKSLQSAVSALASQQSALSTLGANFNALQTALQALGTASQGTPTAQVSDPTAVSAAATAGALSGSYTIQVDNVGSSTTTLSNPGVPPVTDPATSSISSSASYTLTVNNTPFQISASGSSLESLANAINAAGDGVQATIVNVGSNASPDYRLAVNSNNLGTDSIQLNDGSQDLLNTLSTGTNALYKVNGAATDTQSTSRQLTLSPGLTINLLQQTSSPVTVTVATDYSAIQSSLANFVSAYNAAFDALASNRGQSGGALTGDSIIYSLTNVLSSISQYSGGSGAVTSLADLGLTLDQSGHLSFSAITFTAANASAGQAFLGNLQSSGFLLAANNALNSVTDLTNGLVASERTTLQSQTAKDNAQITDDQARITQLQTNLQAELSQADAAIATLQAQQNYFQQLFVAEYGNGTQQSNGG